jgi:hypothetical protein
VLGGEGGHGVLILGLALSNGSKPTPRPGRSPRCSVHFVVCLAGIAGRFDCFASFGDNILGGLLKILVGSPPEKKVSLQAEEWMTGFF